MERAVGEELLWMCWRPEASESKSSDGVREGLEREGRASHGP